MSAKELIESGKTSLGIEFGSTRIKAVLIDMKGNTLAVGFHDWENSLINGIWTYSLEEVHQGIASCYASMKKDVQDKYGVTPTTYASLGISAMMHGYIALDKNDVQLAPFQTWRNSNTEAAADKLTELFDFNIPLRWTIAHLYQRILDGEAHVKNIDYVCTLAAYMHYKLTGNKVLGIGDASGVFPIDSDTHDYNEEMVQKFDELVKPYGYSWKLRDVLPKVMVAGENAGTLTEAGAKILDPSGDLKAGIPLCPPEGDAGTGMVATNSVAPGTGNVSAGTSTFAMVVLSKNLSKLYREIDMVTTPSGFPVAMSHANNGTSDLNAWVSLFGEFYELMTGEKPDIGKLFHNLYTNSLNGDVDCGGLMAHGYLSGEGITHLNEGRPLFVRTADSNFNLANFMRSHLYTSLGAVKLGMDILTKQEGVKIDKLLGHGGLFKTKGVAQRYLSAAVNAPVTVMDTASEGGAWGIAVLAAYLVDGEGMTLEDYLDKKIFVDMAGTTIAASEDEVRGYEIFSGRYVDALHAERAAVESIKW